jgi:hypothetical protein
LAPIPAKQNGQNKLPYNAQNAPRTRSQSRGKITLKQVHQNNRSTIGSSSGNGQTINQTYASKTSERSTFQSVPKYVENQQFRDRSDSGIYSENNPSSYDTNMSVSTNSINLSNMQVDDSSLTTHFHDLHDVSVGSKDADFPMYDESEKMSSTPVTKHDFEFSKQMNQMNELLEYKFYSKEEAYKADWDLSDDINEKNYTSYKNNGIEQYQEFHEEYQTSYYNNMLKGEKIYSANPRYLTMQENYRHERMMQGQMSGMDNQRVPNERAPSYQMRVKVVDWLLELQDHFRMVSSETFHLSVAYIDRYLSAREVKECEMQEVAVTATFLASKFVDYQSPSLRDLSEITAHSVSKRKILDRERHMLKTFTCTLCAPTTYHFLIEIISSQGFTRPQFRQVRRVALYFCDISRLAYDLLIFPNRVMAIACLFLSFTSCGLKFRINSRDNPIIYMNVKTNELIECISALAEVHRKSLSSRFEDNTDSGCTVRGKTTTTQQQAATHPPNAFKNLYVNKRWATTLSTFQKDHENYGSRGGAFKNWHMSVKDNLEELIESW